MMVIVATVIVLATSPILGARPLTLHDGDYLHYEGTMKGAGQTFTMTTTMTFSNVTATRFTAESSVSVNGEFTNATKTFVWNGHDWFFYESLPNGPINLGQEDISTAFGVKSLTHYSDTTNGTTSDSWVDANSIPYRIQYTLPYGVVVLDLVTTNMVK